jgi:hypothetical protein
MNDDDSSHRCSSLTATAQACRTVEPKDDMSSTDLVIAHSASSDGGRCP